MRLKRSLAADAMRYQSYRVSGWTAAYSVSFLMPRATWFVHFTADVRMSVVTQMKIDFVSGSQNFVHYCLLHIILFNVFNVS